MMDCSRYAVAVIRIIIFVTSVDDVVVLVI